MFEIYDGEGDMEKIVAEVTCMYVCASFIKIVHASKNHLKILDPTPKTQKKKLNRRQNPTTYLDLSHSNENHESAIV
jgi:hypothetical protein